MEVPAQQAQQPVSEVPDIKQRQQDEEEDDAGRRQRLQ
jgi:hypothetical protein